MVDGAIQLGNSSSASNLFANISKLLFTILIPVAASFPVMVKVPSQSTPFAAMKDTSLFAFKPLKELMAV